MMESDLSSPTWRSGLVSWELVYLPPDVLSEILSRLPIESIATCRVVCKTLCAVTRGSDFIRNYGASHRPGSRLILKPFSVEVTGPRPSYLVLLDTEERKTRQIPLETTFADHRIMCSCYGLLCMASDVVPDPVVVWNPMTRERVILPPTRFRFVRGRSLLAGLGFDASSNKYKVARFCTLGESAHGNTILEVTSLGESSWRKVCELRQLLFESVRSVAVFFNGALYWAFGMRGNIKVIQVDLQTETFRLIRFDSGLAANAGSLGLVVVGDCLNMVENHDTLIGIWRLTTNGVGGDLSFSLVQTYESYVMWGDHLNKFLCRFDEKGFLIQVGYLDSCWRIWRTLTQFSPDDGTYSNLDIPGLDSNFEAICFKPSLAPLQAAIHN